MMQFVCHNVNQDTLPTLPLGHVTSAMTCAMSVAVLILTCVSPVMDSPTSPLEHAPQAVATECIQIKTSMYVKNVILHVQHVMDLVAIIAAHVQPNLFTRMECVSHVLQDTI